MDVKLKAAVLHSRNEKRNNFCQWLGLCAVNMSLLMDRPQPLFGYFCQCLICSLCCKRVSFYGPTSDSFCSFLFEPRANHLGSFSYSICHWIVKLTKKERGRGWPFYKNWRCYWRHWMSLHFPVICTVKTNLLSCHFTHVVGNKNFIDFHPETASMAH